MVPKLAVFMILDTKATKCRCDGAREHLFYKAFDLQFLICYTPILKGAYRQEAAKLAVLCSVKQRDAPLLGGKSSGPPGGTERKETECPTSGEAWV